MFRVSRLRAFCLPVAALLLLSTGMAGQKSALPSAPEADPNLIANQVPGQLYSALVGHWAGMLEYRKFPSEQRLILPAWLDVTEAPDGKSLTMRYTFDDGTNDVMRETQRVTVSPALHIWTEKAIAQPEDVYKVDGLDKLKDGRGTLVLSNQIVEELNKEEARTNVMIDHNIFIMEQEARAPGQEFSFRHVYRFTRIETPDASAFPSAPTPRK